MSKQVIKYKIDLNSNDKLKDLLQQVYDESCFQLSQSQEQMNKLSESTPLKEASIDEKAKYSKAMNDFLSQKDKAIGRKIEISKLLGEIIKNNGDLKKAVDNFEETNKTGEIDFSKIRDIVDNMKKKDPEEYILGQKRIEKQ